MSINRLLVGSNLKPDEIEVLRLAFKQTLRSLSVVDRRDPLAEMVARRVIEIGASGVRDPAVISKIALERFEIASRPSRNRF
jgi:hypothetical protein